MALVEFPIADIKDSNLLARNIEKVFRVPFFPRLREVCAKGTSASPKGSFGPAENDPVMTISLSMTITLLCAMASL